MGVSIAQLRIDGVLPAQGDGGVHTPMVSDWIPDAKPLRGLRRQGDVLPVAPPRGDPATFEAGPRDRPDPERQSRRLEHRPGAVQRERPGVEGGRLPFA